MKEEIKELQVERVSLLTQYEQKFDLASVKAAAEAAGMSPPSESQIYYIDLPGAARASGPSKGGPAPLLIPLSNKQGARGGLLLPGLSDVFAPCFPVPPALLNNEYTFHHWR